MFENDIGYNLNKAGEGCFSIIGKKKYSMDLIVSFIESDTKIDFEARFFLEDFIVLLNKV